MRFFRHMRRSVLNGPPRLAAVFVFLGLVLFFSLYPLFVIACLNFSDAECLLHEDMSFVKNPNRGFYHMVQTDLSTSDLDYMSMAAEHCKAHSTETLVLLEINLRAYRTGEIDAVGLTNLDGLLSAWEGRDVSLIVRFVYDWDGNGLENDPDDLNVVLGHMAQVGPVLQLHERLIFCLQGLFVGSWGEMHSTKFSDNFDVLAKALDDATGRRMFLSVRTPAQLRFILNSYPELESRLGLFNDGMLGSETDLGTYDMADQGAERRTRVQELAFQDAVCLVVPNGGEVVIDNACNNFENAARDLEQMHVAYLNRAYDQGVLNKWTGLNLASYGFEDLSGLDYIERRLGYRLYVTAVGRYEDGTAYIVLRNAGFGSMLFPCCLTLTACDGTCVGRQVLDLSGLYGGRACVVTVPQAGVECHIDFLDTHTGIPILPVGNSSDFWLPAA